MLKAIALSGGSCVGKTSAAKELASYIQAEARLCGDVIKARARQLGLSLDDIPVNIHREIDEATREWVRSGQNLRVVEGRFLEYVLVGIPNVLRIRLTCADDVRATRMLARGVHGRGIGVEDEHTAVLTQQLYGGLPPTAPEYTIDTSHLTVLDVVNKIVRCWQSQ